MTMRKRIALLVTAVMVALTMSLGAAGAGFADSPFKNPAGHKPPGQTPNPNPGK
jgi:hypothetical protein